MTKTSELLPKIKLDKAKNIRLIELFGGIGSQARGLSNTGAKFERWVYIDNDQYAVKSYNAIHGTNFEPTNILNVTAKDLNIVDKDKHTYIMTYSFPCTNLSTLGKKNGLSPDIKQGSSLLFEVQRIIDECGENLPQVLIMENVSILLSKRYVEHFKEWQEFLTQHGYKNYYEILDAKDFGIPQQRRRVFMVSILGGKYSYEFPKPITLTKTMQDFLEKDPDPKYFLSKKMRIVITSNQKNYYPRPNLYVTNRTIAKTITTREGNARAIESNYISPNLPLDFKMTMGVEAPEPTRRLTPRECFLLMGFTNEDYENAHSVCSDRRLYMQAGNAIVVNVLSAIFEQLF